MCGKFLHNNFQINGYIIDVQLYNSLKGLIMMHEINEDQVAEYIIYNIRQTMEQNNISLEEAAESVRYYFDLLFNSVIAQMEDS